MIPEIKPINKIDLLKPERSTLPNGIPLYVLNAPTEEVSRIDFMFEAGVWNQPRPLVAFFTNQMLKEGSQKMSAFETAQHLDFYGSWLQLSNTYHYSYVTLYSLNKYLANTLEILEQIIKSPVFPENEFETVVNTRKQQFLVDSQKVNVLASRQYQTVLYGEEHPYGKVATTADYESLTVDSLQKFYQQFYHSANCRIVLSGNVTDKMIKQVEQVFGSNSWGSLDTFITPAYPVHRSGQKQWFVEKEDAVQSAVIIGRPLVTFSHPDYHSLQVLNTILGGYFGSRLMSNIREEKGYTYGISAHMSSLLHGGHMTIASQTGTEYTRLLINEVYNEIEKLREETVPNEELNTVKSYMLGDIVRGFDGIFAQADALISLLSRNLDYSFYEKNIETIKNISADTIQQLAQRYFVKDDFYQIVCGKDFS